MTTKELVFGLLGSVACCMGNPLTQVPVGHGTKLAEDTTLLPYRDFIASVEHATIADFNGTAVDSVAAFDGMKTHVLWLYANVTSATSFIYENNTVDCISIYEQAAFRKFNISQIAVPPVPHSAPNTSFTVSSLGNVTYAESPLKLSLTDHFGNPVSCPNGTFPMSRMTLETLTSYSTLSDFFDKGSPFPNPSNVSGGLRQQSDWDPVILHAEGFQNVENFGGNSFINLWDPAGDFSLSQVWYTIGSGSAGGGTNHQTVEGGWVAYKQKFHTSKSVFFIFTTADDYQSVKCWNHDCGAFMQTNKDWYLGGPFDRYSSIDGVQVGFEIQWHLYNNNNNNNNWWLHVRGASNNYETIGYYPSEAFFPDGILYVQVAHIEYGGVMHRIIGHPWPVMGSGRLAEQGFGKAAFQESIFFIPKNQDGGSGAWADLTALDEAKEACYMVDLTSATEEGSVGTFLLFGGAGGNNCPLP